MRRRKFATQSQHAYEALRERIITRQLVPGEDIVMERVAAELGMSPIPLRDALGELAAENLVTRVPGKGWSVAELSHEEFAEASIVRLAMEIESVRRCALKVMPDDIRSLREMAHEVDEVATEHGGDAIRGLEREFHLRIAEIGGCGLLRDQLEQWLIVMVVGEVGVPPAEQEHLHSELVDAIATGDPDAAEREMRRHVESGIACDEALLDAAGQEMAVESTADAR